MDGRTEADIEKEVETAEFKSTYKPSPKTEDGRNYLLKKGRYGLFWAHPDYPKTKDAQPLEYTPKKLRELYGEPPVADDGREFEFRSGKFGPYWAHPDYPETKETVKIKQKVDKDSEES